MRATSLFAVFFLSKLIITAGHNVPVSLWSPIAYLWQDLLVALFFGALDFSLRRPWACWCAYWLTILYTALNIPVARVLSTPLTWPMLHAARGPLSDSLAHHLTWVNILFVLLILAVSGVLPFLLHGTLVRFSNDHERQPRAETPYTASLQRRPKRLVEKTRFCGFEPQSRFPFAVLVSLLCLVLALGPVAAARVETLGLHRNALVALIASAIRSAPSDTAASGGRLSGFDEAAVHDWMRPLYSDGRPENPQSEIRTVQSEDLSSLRGAAAGRNIIMVSLESTAAQYLHLTSAGHNNRIGNVFRMRKAECGMQNAAIRNRDDPMPHLSELAAKAIVFENTYAVYPESIKGLFSVLCSTFPALDTATDIYSEVPCRPLPAVLAGAGYRTALFHSGRFMYLGMESIIRNRGYETLEDAGEIGGNQESSFGVDEPSTVRRMLSWIDSLPSGHRFFLTFLPIAGHHPYETLQPGPFPENEEIGRYRNALHYGDAALDSLARGLRERGLEEKTLWVIFGDHGEAFGQHDGNFGHTFFLYDENVRVPLVVAAPGLLRKQVQVQRVISLIDAAPTILDLAGLPIPETYQGRSVLNGESRMALFFTDYSLRFLGLRDQSWKFIVELDSGRSKLFDLGRDPGERNDLSPLHDARAGRYAQHLLRWSAAQKNFTRSTHAATR
ncbi:MAG TPA: sulfatase [Acidobacteriota bacterium]|jgi:arylsulfatase A-like enzyme|nr:sulfatase [Acidobacteriota bacterium]